MRIKFAFVLLATILFFEDGRVFAQPPERASFCDLFGLKDYDGTLVRTEALLFIPAVTKAVAESSDEYFFSKACNNRDYFALADFSKAGPLTLISREGKKAVDKTEPRLYLVGFEGRISTTLPPKFGHLSFLRAKFEVTEIKSVTTVPSGNGPDMEASAPIIEASREISAVDSELMLSIYRSQMKPAEVADLITKESKISINEKRISRENFLKTTFIENNGKLEHTITGIVNEGGTWKVKGRMVNSLEGNLTRKMEYENEYFRLEDGSWRLRVLVANIL